MVEASVVASVVVETVVVVASVVDALKFLGWNIIICLCYNKTLHFLALQIFVFESPMLLKIFYMCLSVSLSVSL